MDRIPMTSKGYDRLVDELKQLKSVERPKVIQAIAEARDHGDLSENAEYDAAREKQGFVEGRIAEIESCIGRADVIDISKLNGDTVKFGATVLVADEDTDEETTYQIVGEYEADINQGLLSLSAPMARALIGKSLGDQVEVSSPRGTKCYEIIDIKYV